MTLEMSTMLRRRRTLAALDPRLDFAINHHCNTRGKPMTLDRRGYLLDIYRDRTQTRVFKKSVQCGISEMLIIDALESASRGLACLYVMPTQERRDKFVANRVSRVIRASKHYRALIGSGAGQANSMGLKHFGPGVINFVGSNGESEFVEFPADLVIVDELDRCSADNLPLVRDRLGASPHKLAAYASTPTFPEFGVAKLFEKSDGKEWFVRCEACGEAQALDFFANVVRREEEGRYVLLDGEWEESLPRMDTDERGEEKENQPQMDGDERRSGEEGEWGEAEGARTPGAGDVGGRDEGVRLCAQANTFSADEGTARNRDTASRGCVRLNVQTNTSSTGEAPGADDGRRDIRVFCVRCGRPLDRLGPGEWVARHPGREVSGYHISQLFVPTVAVRLLWEDWQRAMTNAFERQRFHNSLLGEPYAPEGSGLSLADLVACCRDYEMPNHAAACTMGVDVGEWMHVRISDHPEPGVRRAVFIGRVQSVAELDRLIERYDVRCCVVDAQPEAHLIRNWQQGHPRGRIWRCVYTENDLREIKRDAARGVVEAARTPTLDAATEDIVMHRNWLPRNAETLDGGDFVAHMLAPVRQKVEDARGNPRVVWTKGAADHHRHADNYERIASELWSGERTVIKVVAGPATRRFPRAPARMFKAA